jgi:hypothetical protein
MCKTCIVIQDFKLWTQTMISMFFVELPRSLNIPDTCICYIDDIVIPVSWSSIDARNNNLYIHILIGMALYIIK